MPLIAYPSSDVIWTATLSMTNPSTDPDYAIENAQGTDPANTVRADGVSTVVTIDTGGAITPAAAMVVNTNATAINLANSAGLDEDFVIPSRTPDGKQRNGWVDLRGSPEHSDGEFDLTLSKTGTEDLEFGRICLLFALEDLEIVWAGAGPSPVFSVRRPGDVDVVTRLGTVHRRPSPTFARRLRASFINATQFPILERLEAESRGLNRGFFFVPDEDENDAWFAQFTLEDFTYAWDQPGATPISVIFDELVMGLAPDLE